jgi:hypothetical protein
LRSWEKPKRFFDDVFHQKAPFLFLLLTLFTCLYLKKILQRDFAANFGFLSAFYNEAELGEGSIWLRMAMPR